MSFTDYDFLLRGFAVLLKELFVQHLALSSFNHGSGKESNTLSYSDLAHTAEQTETFHFLTGELFYSIGGSVDKCIWSGRTPKNEIIFQI